jgi:GT2 family glycosyltransferase
MKDLSISPNPLVCVVVLNYNGCAHLKYCLLSLVESYYSNFRILVVDNASTDDSADMIATLCPSAQLIQSEKNRGWSGGNNVGIQEALLLGAKYIILANNDIMVDPRCLAAAVEVAERDPRVGIVGFQVLEPRPENPDRGAGFEKAKATWSKLELYDPKYVGGMAMFVRAQLFEQLGLIDENFFAYGEENDFQIRARKAGYKIIATNVPVWHCGQGSFGQVPILAARLQIRNNIQLLIKHGVPSQIIRSGLKHICWRVLCITRYLPDSNAVEQRLLLPNRLARVYVLLEGLCWNLMNLHSILKRRSEDNGRVVKTSLWLKQKGLI